MHTIGCEMKPYTIERSQKLIEMIAITRLVINMVYYIHYIYGYRQTRAIAHPHEKNVALLQRAEYKNPLAHPHHGTPSASENSSYGIAYRRL